MHIVSPTELVALFLGMRDVKKCMYKTKTGGKIMQSMLRACMALKTNASMLDVRQERLAVSHKS